jgi:hypothetical protein
MSARRKKPTPEQLAVEEEERELLRRFCALPSLRQIPFLAKAGNAAAERFKWADDPQEPPAEVPA